MGEPTDPNSAAPYEPPPPFAQPPAQPGQQQYPYGQQYPPAAAQGYPSPYPPPPPPSAGTSNNRKVWAFVAALLVLIVGGVIALVVVGSDDDSSDTPVATHRVRVPATFTGYERLTSSQAKQVEQNMRDRLTSSSDYLKKIYSAARVGIYARSGQSSPALVFIGVDGTSSDTLQDLLEANSPAENVDSFLLGASVKDSESFPAGHFGGTLKCGMSGPSAGGGEAMCVWIDRSTLGIVMADSAHTTDLSELAGSTRTLRSAAEH